MMNFAKGKLELESLEILIQHVLVGFQAIPPGLGEAGRGNRSCGDSHELRTDLQTEPAPRPRLQRPSIHFNTY